MYSGSVVLLNSMCYFHLMDQSLSSVKETTNGDVTMIGPSVSKLLPVVRLYKAAVFVLETSSLREACNRIYFCFWKEKIQPQNKQNQILYNIHYELTILFISNQSKRCPLTKQKLICKSNLEWKRSLIFKIKKIYFATHSPFKGISVPKTILDSKDDGTFSL